MTPLLPPPNVATLDDVSSKNDGDGRPSKADQPLDIVLIKIEIAIQ
jgi:hypothetical protein